MDLDALLIWSEQYDDIEMIEMATGVLAILHERMEKEKKEGAVE